MDEKLVKFCFLKFKAVLSFFKSLNLSRLNSKSLENSLSITCCVRRKVIRKGVGNVTKNGKALLKYTKYVAKKFECQCRCPVLK